MPKREQTLSPIGEVIVAERKALGIRVVDFCHEAHISRVTYYELLKGNNTPSRYTADSCAVCRRGTFRSPAVGKGNDSVG